MKRLQGKKAVIVGGNRGIGRAIAKAFVKEGAEVVISYYDGEEEAMQFKEEVLQKFGVDVNIIQMDITDTAKRENFVEEAIEHLGEINILVNSAGICPRGSFLDVEELDFDAAMNTNLKGAFFLTQLVGRHMAKKGKGGSIINISSSRDESVMADLSVYATSKAALTMLSKSAALDLSKYGIRVNIISPGLTQTDMHRPTWEKKPDMWQKRIAEIPIGRAGQAEDIANCALYLASDAESGYVTGARFLIDGGRSLGSTR